MELRGVQICLGNQLEIASQMFHKVTKVVEIAVSGLIVVSLLMSAVHGQGLPVLINS